MKFPSLAILKWLYVGLGVKRWLALLFLGVTLLALGAAYFLFDLYRHTDLPDYFYFLTLQFLDRYVRGVLLGVLGLGMVVLAIVQLSRALILPFTAGETDVAEALIRKRVRKRGPKIVAMGGGTGLSTLLRGLKVYTDHITAIVTVADDGGSSGRLRRELGMLPPGDFRQCIAALADSEPLMSSLLQYRFADGSGLEGHSFGNLFIAAMAGITGDFDSALQESSRVLAVRGQVLPSTLQNVTLVAETGAGMLERVAGESNISHQGKRIARVFLEPEDVSAYPGVVRAILDADLIIAGPGSLYTSVLPNLLVNDIRRALEASHAAKVYVCNVATQPGETDNFSVQDHFAVLEEYAGKGMFSSIIANNNFDVKFSAHSSSQMVHVRDDQSTAAEMILIDLVDESLPWRHAPAKLAKSIIKWYNSQSKK